MLSKVRKRFNVAEDKLEGKWEDELNNKLFDISEDTLVARRTIDFCLHIQQF